MSSARPARDGFLPAPLATAPLASAAQACDDAGRSETGLVEYWRVLRRQKGTVILVAFLGLLVAVLVTVPQTPVYQARTTLEVQDLNQEFMNLKQVSPLLDSPGLNALGDMQTQIKILQSEALLDRTLSKLHIDAPAGLAPQPSRIAAWRRALNLEEPPPVDARDKALAAAAKTLRVRAAGQTRIIEVRVDSADPKLASDFANTLAAEFIEQNMEARWQMTQRTGDWLARQLEDVRIKLERSEDALHANARQNGLVITADRQNVSEERLRQVQAELSKAQADRVAKQSRYEITRTATPETVPDVLSDSQLRALQVSLTDLRRQAAELSATFKPDYSKSRKVRAQIAELESALKRERETVLSRIANEYQEAQRRENLLAFAFGAQARVVSQDSERSVQYNILKREVDTNRQIYEAMLSRVKESGIASAMRASNIRVIDGAKLPKNPYKPILPLNAALGLVSGLVLGIAGVVMRERADRSLQEPGDAAFYTGLPELGVIPSALAGRHHRVRRAAAHTLPAPAGLDSDFVELSACNNTPSLMAEGFRTVVVSLMFSGNSSRARVLVITSPGPGDGKTTAASNLAIALAQIEQRVLLVDGDLRKPRIHDIFNLDNSAGLGDLLRKARTQDDKLADEVIRESGVPNLYVLTSGPPANGACNLLFSSAMPILISRFKKRFDMVIIDTPPMLQMPDARVLGRVSDGVILVARSGRTTRAAAVAARERLAHDRTRALGVILNYWNPKHAPNGYYGYYGRGSSARAS